MNLYIWYNAYDAWGTVVGLVVGVIINGIFYTEINGKSIAGYIEDGIEGLLEWLF